MRAARCGWVAGAVLFGVFGGVGVSPGLSDVSRSDAARPEGAPLITGASFETRAVSRGLEREARALASGSAGPLWAGYAVPAVESGRRMCCWDSVSEATASRGCCGTCRLEKANSFNISSDHGQRDGKASLEPSGRFFVLFRAGASGVGKIRAFSEECKIDSGRLPFVWLTAALVPALLPRSSSSPPTALVR